MNQFSVLKPTINERIYADQAQADDTGAVMSLLRDTALWLQSKGSTQWSQLIEGHDVHGMANSIRNGDVFQFKSIDTDSLAAVVMLLQQPSAWDQELWGEAANTNEAIYVHRLAINRKEAATGLGKDVMRWVEDGITFPGKNRIRLDCIEGNDKLFQFYNSLGYVHKGVHGSGFHCFEKLH